MDAAPLPLRWPAGIAGCQSAQFTSTAMHRRRVFQHMSLSICVWTTKKKKKKRWSEPTVAPSMSPEISCRCSKRFWRGNVMPRATSPPHIFSCPPSGCCCDLVDKYNRDPSKDEMLRGHHAWLGRRPGLPQTRVGRGEQRRPGEPPAPSRSGPWLLSQL